MTQSEAVGELAPRSGPGRDLQALLENYVRYATLVRFQEEALDRQDLDRFETLARAREAIQEEIGTEPPPLPEGEDLDPDTRDYLERILENFRDTLLLDSQLRARLQKLKKEASGDLKTVDDRGGHVKGYLAGEEVTSNARLSRLNVRL